MSQPGPKQQIEGAEQAADDISTLLGRGSEFSGKLSFDGAVRIDGRFSGEIRSDGTLVVGAEAEIDADIIVSRVVVQGRVQGNITAREHLEIHAPARVEGKLACKQLSIERGVVFDGSCDMSTVVADEPGREEPQAPPSKEGKDEGEKASAEK